MRISELLTELTFMGSPCTKDCSGHIAGYKWGQRNGGTIAASPSNSFNNGTKIAAAERKPAAKGPKKVPVSVSKAPAAKKNVPQAPTKIP